MNKRSKLWAILGAGVLTLGVVGIALAEELKDAHQGIVVSWDDEGNATVDGFDKVGGEECDGEDLEAGEVLFHFVQSGGGDDPVVPNAPGNNLLDVDFEDESDQTGIVEDGIQGGNVDWFALVDASDGEVELVTAESNVEGGELRVSHICVGDAPDEETAPPSFEQSQEGETDAPSDEPSFEQSQGGVTDEPTEPNTSMIGNGGTSAPADGAWLLVVALGVLLASIVVLSPARAKNLR